MENRMLRTLTLAATLCMPACTFWHGVSRCTPAPADFDPVLAQEVAQGHPGWVPAESIHWDGEAFLVVVRDGDANAAVGYLLEETRQKICLSSLWMNTPPSAAELARSIELQRELLQRLRARIEGLPPFQVWTTETFGDLPRLDER